MPDGQVPWDAARTLKSLGGDERLFHEIINIFLEEAPRQMASMREALALGDKHATERIAHTLKGELGYLGITEASRNARELEDAGRNGDMERAADHTCVARNRCRESGSYNARCPCRQA